MKYTELMEAKNHGSPNFPIQYYYIDKSHPQYIMPPHWHRELEIIRVLTGEFSIFLNNVKYRLESGDILFIECGCLHRGIPLDCTYECVVFNPNMLVSRFGGAAEKYVSDIADSRSGIHCLLSSGGDRIYSTVVSLFTVMCRENKFYELEVYGILFKILTLLYTEGYVTTSVKTQRSRRTDTVTDLIKWIDGNYKDGITLNELSERAGLNKNYLCKLFREYTSKTPIEYINGLKIENACYEMTVNGKSVTSSAYDSGFNDLSYFCKTFKILKGITPKQYAKNKIIN